MRWSPVGRAMNPAEEEPGCCLAKVVERPWGQGKVTGMKMAGVKGILEELKPLVVKRPSRVTVTPEKVEKSSDLVTLEVGSAQLKEPGKPGRMKQ